MLKITKLKKVFSEGMPTEQVVLDDLDLHIKNEDFVCIIGSNGAGKSTLFNAISGFFLADAGSIFLNGENITYDPEYKRARTIGRLFQDPMMGTAPRMTIAENLALAYSRVKRGIFTPAITSDEIRIFRDSLAEFEMGLEDRMDAQVGLLSGGQRQALTLLMATLVPPKLLLLDEHTAALDPPTAKKVLELTHSIIAKHKLTTLMITHNIQSALTSGNRTIMLDSGKVFIDLEGQERDTMTVPKLMDYYAAKANKTLDNDRMLLA